MVSTLSRGMWSKTVWVAAALTLAFAFLPFATNAETTIAAMPTGTTDITEEVFGEEEAPGDSAVFAFNVPTEGETYSFSFQDEEECPAVVLAFGGLMTEEANWTCNAETYLTTVTVEHTGFVSGVFDEGEEAEGDLEEEHDDIENILIIGMTNVAPDGNGPSENERYLEDGQYSGMHMSTNVSEWLMVPPSPDNIAFGFSLTGPFGEQGFFRFFLPDGTIDSLSMLAEEELTAEDLVVYNDGNQASLAVEDVDNGAMVDINVLFVPTISTVPAFSGAENGPRMITKTLAAGQAQDISLAAKKTRLKKGRKTVMYGWVQGASKGDKVRIDRGRTKKKVKRYKKCIETATDGEMAGKCIERKKKFRTTTIKNNNGYYKFKVKATKKGWWIRTSAKVDGERIFSEKVQVKAKKKS